MALRHYRELDVWQVGMEQSQTDRLDTCFCGRLCPPRHQLSCLTSNLILRSRMHSEGLRFV